MLSVPPPDPGAVPREPDPLVPPRGFPKVPGPTERLCVRAAGLTTARSGEFVAGNFQLFKAGWSQVPRTHKLFWVPLHQSRLGSLGHPAADLMVWAIPLRGGPYYGELLTSIASSDGLFFPDGPPLPSRGPWRLVGLTGPDWGCFDITL